MPKAISYTPAWLTRPAPGYDFFVPTANQSGDNNGKAKAGEAKRPKKTMATRGTELFVVVGNEIRWTDMVKLKESTEGSSSQSLYQSNRIEHPGDLYRTLRVPVHGKIKQLVISPEGDYMAVATSHTIHIAILPEFSQLDSDTKIIKPKTFQLGPTAHVLDESPIASILWHPLGHHGHCLVTITIDAVIRQWELNRADRSTFSEPSLSVDLKKLANATSNEEDLGASKFGANKGFSPDSVELEVVSACFGDFPEQEGVHGWAPMTLWIAMAEGDVYALCPFLPSKWQLNRSESASTFIQTLSTSIETNYASVQEDPDASAEARETAANQLSWLSDLKHHEPFEEISDSGEIIDVYSRPGSTPACPLLQGPFTLVPELDEEIELSDIIVFSLKTFSEFAHDEVAEGIPAAVICLLTDTCKVHLCLDLEGIEARWLPSNMDWISPPESPEHNLVLVETIELSGNTPISPSAQQVITPDVHSDYAFFVTHPSGVFYISMESWIRKLENELCVPQGEGAEFRSQLLFEKARTVVEYPLPIEPELQKSSQAVTSSIVIEDGNIGYFLLTLIGQEPFGALLDTPDNAYPFDGEVLQELSKSVMVAGMDFTQESKPRVPFQPAKELYDKTKLMDVIINRVPQRRRGTLKEEVRLSPANLDLLMHVHRVLSKETNQLGVAVADLFRRCERLRDEFRNQISMTADLTVKIDSVTGEDELENSNNIPVNVGNAKLEEQFEGIRRRQEELSSQYDRIRRKLASVGNRELSEKESYWVEELEIMDFALDQTRRTDQKPRNMGETPTWQRLQELKGLKEELAGQAEAVSKAVKEEGHSVRVPPRPRREENEEVQRLLEMDADLIKLTVERLQKLGISVPMKLQESNVPS